MQTVAPAELESLLLSHPDVLDAGVIGIKASDGVTELPRAFIVPRPDVVGATEDGGSTVDEGKARLFELDVVGWVNEQVSPSPANVWTSDAGKFRFLYWLREGMAVGRKRTCADVCVLCGIGVAVQEDHRRVSYRRRNTKEVSHVPQRFRSHSHTRRVCAGRGWNADLECDWWVCGGGSASGKILRNALRARE